VSATLCPYREIPRYTCRRASGPADVDGNLDKPFWRDVERTSLFADIHTGARAHLETRAALCWDDVGLYIGFWVSDPDVRTLDTERAMLSWQENAVLLCLAFPGAVYELGVNPAGRTAPLTLVWKDAYARGSHYDIPEFDLARLQPFVLGEDHKTDHARGPRWGFEQWTFPGLHSAVCVDGTLNDRQQVDRGWTAEIALPWSGMKLLDDKEILPPRDGTTLRLELGRTEVVEGPGRSTSALWTWARHGGGDLHVPECFPVITLAVP
jgi:hypothetical protein